MEIRLTETFRARDEFACLRKIALALCSIPTHERNCGQSRVYSERCQKHHWFSSTRLLLLTLSLLAALLHCLKPPGTWVRHCIRETSTIPGAVAMCLWFWVVLIAALYLPVRRNLKRCPILIGAIRLGPSVQLLEMLSVCFPALVACNANAQGPRRARSNIFRREEDHCQGCDV